MHKQVWRAKQRSEGNADSTAGDQHEPHDGRNRGSGGGGESWELPVPATYVVARTGRIALAYIEVDYRKRLGPEAILEALRSLQPS